MSNGSCETGNCYRPQTDAAEKPWMSIVLRLAAIYNLVFGAFAILTPSLFFSLAGMQQPLYPEIWQCLGMVIGVYGLGYWIASSNPIRHWPIVFVGLLGKIFGPIGFLWSLSSGKWPLSAGWMNISNDVIWWLPFGAILYASLKELSFSSEKVAPEISTEELKKLSSNEKVLLVFLRHAGCTFCRETLKNLKKFQEQNNSNEKLVIVHLGKNNEQSKKFFAKYSLQNARFINDPGAMLYKEFGLDRGSFKQLFGFSVFVRGIQAFFQGNGIGKKVGDPFRMHAVFLLDEGKVINQQIPKHAGEVIDFQALSS